MNSDLILCAEFTWIYFILRLKCYNAISYFWQHHLFSSKSLEIYLFYFAWQTCVKALCQVPHIGSYYTVKCALSVAKVITFCIIFSRYKYGVSFWHVSVDVSARTKVNVRWITVRLFTRSLSTSWCYSISSEELELEELKEAVI